MFVFCVGHIAFVPFSKFVAVLTLDFLTFSSRVASVV